MSKTIRNLLIVGVLLLAGFFSLRAWQNSRNATAESNYQTYSVERGTLTAQVGATGTVRAAQTATLTWQTNGRVANVYVDVGDQVQADQVLADLASDSVSQAIILAQADLVNAQRALDNLLQSKATQAQAQLALVQAQKALEDAEKKVVATRYPRASQDTIDNVRAQLDLAEANLSRAEQLYNAYKDRPDGDEKKAQALLNLTNARKERDRLRATLDWYLGNYDDLDIAEREANYALAQANYEDALREWERVKDGPTEDDIAAAQARVDAARALLNMAKIIAPFSGTITEISVQVGDIVTAGTPAFRIDNLDHLLVDVEIPEVDINSVQVGQPVTLSFDAVLDKEYHGEVIEVGQVGKIVQGVTNFTVTIELTDADEQIKPGMTAAVSIVVREIQDALLIPNRAVRVLNGKRVVYKLYDDGTLEPIEIRLGASSDNMSVLLNEALQEGDVIVLNPPTNFEGQGGPPFGR